MLNVLKTIAYFSAAVLVAKFAHATRTFLVARLLDPSEFGVWVVFMTVYTYTCIGHFGTLEALVKQVPFYVGMGRLSKARSVEAAVLGCLVFSFLIILAGGVSLHFFSGIESLRNVLPIVRPMVLAFAVTYFADYFYYRFAAHQDFARVSILEVLRALLGTLIMVVLTWLWALEGTAWGFLATEAAVCLVGMVLSFRLIGKVAPSFDLRMIGNMIRVGFPITAVWWALALQATLDRLISASLLGRTATGHYGLGMSVVSMFYLVPRVVSRVLYPRMNERLGQTSDLKSVGSLVIIPARALSLAIPLLAGAVLFALPTLYRELLPKYVPGLLSAQILVLGVFFMALIANGANFLITGNRSGLLLRHIFAGLVVKAIGAVTLIRLGLKIEAVAISTVVSGAVLTTLVWTSVLGALGLGRADRFREVLRFSVPSLLLIVLIASLGILSPGLLSGTTFSRLLGFGVSLVLFCGLVFCFRIYRSWASDLVRMVRSPGREASAAMADPAYKQNT